MPQRFYITLGATTSAGGTVVSASSLMALDGVRVALEGDEIACPACDGVGIIGADGPRLPVRDAGRLHALSGDLCLCGCEPPPRLVAAQERSGQTG